MSWTEKYRPRSEAEYVGNKPKVESLLEALRKERDGGDKCPHIALLGREGLGKTSLVNVIKWQFGFKTKRGKDVNVMEINASKQGKIDVLRGTIDKFMKITSIPNPTLTKSIGRKLLILEEFDNASKPFQQAFRRDAEQYAGRVLIIITGNYKHKIIPPILSRTLVVDFAPATEDEMVPRLQEIAEQEGLDVSDEQMALIVEKSDGKMRDAINLLQSVQSGKFIANDDTREQVRALLKVLRATPYFAFKEMRKLVNTVADPRRIIYEILELIVFNEKAPEPLRSKVAKLLGEFDFRIVEGGSPDVQLAALVSELIEAWNDK